MKEFLQRVENWVYNIFNWWNYKLFFVSLIWVFAVLLAIGWLVYKFTKKLCVKKLSTCELVQRKNLIVELVAVIAAGIGISLAVNTYELALLIFVKGVHITIGTAIQDVLLFLIPFAIFTILCKLTDKIRCSDRVWFKLVRVILLYPIFVFAFVCMYQWLYPPKLL